MSESLEVAAQDEPGMVLITIHSDAALDGTVHVRVDGAALVGLLAQALNKRVSLSDRKSDTDVDPLEELFDTSP